MKKKLIFLLLCLSLVFSSYASNFHEHLISLPFPSNIISESEAIFSLDSKDQVITKCFEEDGEFELFMRETQGWDDETYKHFIENYGDEATLLDLCEFMGGDKRLNLYDLLTFRPEMISSPENRSIVYCCIESLRKLILMALPIDNFTAVYSRYFEEEPLENRKYISLALTKRFFCDNQKDKVLALQKLADEYGSKVVYRVSLQRNRLLKYGIDYFEEDIFEYIGNGDIEGIDLVGSLKEKYYTYNYSSEDIERQLGILFNYISDNDKVLVLHIFESANDDIFYRSLEKALLNHKKKLYLEIGHIACVDKKWLDIFSSNKDLKVMFHANLKSNMELHGCSLELLKNNIAYIQSYGFKVVLGSDGRGILRGSSYEEQNQYLDCCVSKDSFLTAKLKASQKEKPLVKK